MASVRGGEVGGEAARGWSGQREEAGVVTMRGGDWELGGGGAHGVDRVAGVPVIWHRGLVLWPRCHLC